MIHLTERVIDILRRCGPGVLPARKLMKELLRDRTATPLSPRELRQVAARSGDRLRLLEVALDRIDHRPDSASVDSWIVLMAPEDAPDGSRLVVALWRSLATLAGEIDPASRLQMCRWAIKAEEARRLTAP